MLNREIRSEWQNRQAVNSSFSQQIVPATAQSLFYPIRRGDQYIDLASLNALDVADIQVSIFGEFLLGKVFTGSLPSNILAELDDEFLLFERHKG